MNEMTSSQFVSTYKCAYAHFFGLSSQHVDLPNACPMHLKIINPSSFVLVKPTKFLLVWLYFVSTSLKYLEQNVVHSSTRYPSAIKLSG